MASSCVASTNCSASRLIHVSASSFSSARKYGVTCDRKAYYSKSVLFPRLCRRSKRFDSTETSSPAHQTSSYYREKSPFRLPFALFFRSRRPIRSFDRYATYLLYEKQEREQLSDRCVNNAVIIRCSFCWFSYAACGPSYFAPRIRHSDCPRIAEQRSDRKQRTTMSNYFVSFERESQARSESSRATRSYFGRADRYAWPLHD